MMEKKVKFRRIAKWTVVATRLAKLKCSFKNITYIVKGFIKNVLVIIDRIYLRER